MKRKPYRTLSKWRKLTTISLAGDEDRGQMIQKAIAQGYRYNNGFVATSHREGYSGDDFMQNAYSIVFFLIRVPRIVKKVKRKHDTQS